MHIAPGAAYFPWRISQAEQQRMAQEALALGAADAGFYTPIVRGGRPMSVRMLCLGRHWNARTYTYEAARSDIDQRPAPPLPAGWSALAHSIAEEAGMPMRADLCIVNWYGRESRMGLHQDKDESRASIESGAPVVSISIGQTAKFLFGGLRRKDPVQTLLLRSGDAFVFGGPSRLRYHGVSRILAGTAPPGLEFDGRLNFTFRQF